MSCANERRILFNSHAMANSILALHVDGGVVAALRRRPADHGVQPTTARSRHARPTCSQASNVAAWRHGHDCSIELKAMRQPVENHAFFASGVLHTVLNDWLGGWSRTRAISDAHGAHRAAALADRRVLVEEVVTLACAHPARLFQDITHVWRSGSARGGRGARARGACRCAFCHTMHCHCVGAGSHLCPGPCPLPCLRPCPWLLLRGWCVW